MIQQGAYLANNPQDIVEQLGGSFQWLPPSEKPSLPKEQMTLPFADVFAHIEYDVTPVDIIAERVDQSVSELVIKLLELELVRCLEVMCPSQECDQTPAANGRRNLKFIGYRPLWKP